MELKIQQWGNSAAVRMPATLLKQMGLTSGDALKVISATPDALTLKPAKTKPHYRLSGLVAQCDLNAAKPAQLEACYNMQPIGREA